MTEQKLKSACEFFARIECANNCDGQCLPRDCPCFVYAERGWVCTWLLFHFQAHSPKNSFVAPALHSCQRQNERQSKSVQGCPES